VANKVSFIIQLKDKFGRTAAKVNRQFAGMKQKADAVNKSIVAMALKGQKALGAFGKSAVKTGAIMTAALTAPIVLMGKKMIDAASDATETANKFNSVFDEVEGKANKVADSFAKSFGTAGSTARKLIGDTGDLLVGFGFTGDAALDISRKVNELAADLTSFQNVEGGVDAASAALTKALLGEAESAKSLGIVIRQNTKEFRTQVKTIARVRGITEQQAKAIVILGQATQQSRKAIGDVNRTWEDYASVVRRNTERNKEMSESFGRLLLPIATKVLNKITQLVKWVSNLSPGMKKFVLIMAGLVAIGGPLLVVLGGIALAFSAITLPVLAIGAAIIAVGAIIIAAVANWETITDFFGTVWEKAKAGLMDFANFGIEVINSLLAPLNFVAEKLGLGSVKISSIQAPAPAAPSVNSIQAFKNADDAAVNSIKAFGQSIQAPSAPSQSGSGTIDGQITVAATPGTEVRQSSIQARGKGMNVGMNMAGAQ